MDEERRRHKTVAREVPRNTRALGHLAGLVDVVRLGDLNALV